MEVYIVIDGSCIVGGSTSQQGAEEIRADYIQREAARSPNPDAVAKYMYGDEGVQIALVNVRVDGD